MTNRGQQAIAILYEHALLGEGIAQYLRARADTADTEVTLAQTGDAQALRAALAGNPGVVVFERGGLPCDLDLAALAPGAELLDISDAVGRGSTTGPQQVGLEQIAQAVRRHAPAGRRPRSLAARVRHPAHPALNAALNVLQARQSAQLSARDCDPH